MKRFIILLIAVVFLSGYAFSEDSMNIGSTDILIEPSGEALATAGGIYSEIGLSSTIFNPALITKLNERFNVSFSYFNGIFPENDVKSFNMSLTPKPRLHGYLNYSSYSNPDLIRTDELGNILGEGENIAGNKLIKFGFAHDLNTNFSLGLEYKIYSAQIPETDLDTWTITYNYLSLGAYYKLDLFEAALSVSNISLFDNDPGESTPQNIMLNLLLGKKLLKNKLALNGILSLMPERSSDKVRGGVAAEYNLLDLIFFRLGYFHSVNIQSFGLYPGIGIHYKNMDLDYTFSYGDYYTYHYLTFGYGFDPPQKKRIVKEKKKKDKKKKVKKEGGTQTKEKLLVAILDFEANNIELTDARIITNFIRQDMINSGYFTVLERGAIEDIMEEVKFQQTGCASAECAVEIGKILAVEKMVVGTVSKLGKKYFLTIRMVDVESSKISFATSIDASVSIEKLPTYVTKLVDKMVDALSEGK
ncbi:hypothetical protein KAU32_13365 [bacterium]|nr:hypothetical protein [bacterium]